MAMGCSTLIVYRADSDDMEVFTRDANGSVRPASSQVLEAHKKQNAAFAEFFDNTLMATNLNSATVEERIHGRSEEIQETQQKINEQEGGNRLHSWQRTKRVKRELQKPAPATVTDDRVIHGTEALGSATYEIIRQRLNTQGPRCASA